MKDAGKKTKLQAYGKLIQGGISMLVCLAILLYSAFAWFSSARSTTATGMGVVTKIAGSLRVTATSGAADEALMTENVQNEADYARLFALADASDEKIGPGVSGEFTAFVTPSGSNTVMVLPKVCAGGRTLSVNGDGTEETVALEPYRNNLTAESDSVIKAEPYMQGHILLFRTKENNIYSDWVNPFAENSVAMTNPNGENAVTFYWVWVESYELFCTPDRLIAEADLNKIRAYYFNVDGSLNVSKTNVTSPDIYLFDTRTNNYDGVTKTELSNYYDFADEDIGSSIYNLYFDILFRPT